MKKIIDFVNDDNYVDLNKTVQEELRKRVSNLIDDKKSDYLGENFNYESNFKSQYVNLMEEKAGHFSDEEKKELISLMEDTEFDNIDEFEKILDEKILLVKGN